MQFYVFLMDFQENFVFEYQNVSFPNKEEVLDLIKENCT